MTNIGADRFLPARLSLPESAEAARSYKGCDLFRNATQTAFGAGRQGATYMFAGERPGDQEDRRGAPFVGPAGRMLDRGPEEAGIDRDFVYVTNGDKHFTFEPRGKRRIQQKPTTAEIEHVGKIMLCGGHSLRGPVVREARRRSDRSLR
ncbi:hypothetical protein Pmi06nite_28460 [Planotetraspora mira]|uniref:Uracil-DNA glycosylase-like domain-containing protein n=2 Tax=Planotetraspora mira TaxID=58121 RepID=A0A8J3X713_9ACTN|nr:hypothetical protein Pmi06nite_28460 [Planotetraspora mira]